MDTHDANLEKYNTTGLRDAYGVLKHLEDIKDKPINERKGGTQMDDKKIPVDDSEVTEVEQPVQPEQVEVDTSDLTIEEVTLKVKNEL